VFFSYAVNIMLAILIVLGYAVCYCVVDRNDYKKNCVHYSKIHLLEFI